ncbi:MAG: PTS sugar transporter subunit IIA [Lachnospiraceae bacterium]|jgi:PTS system mannose-specific IIA component|nr:PTS sugar transporter subunit IIA [Lachnospiraceae bacterium]
MFDVIVISHGGFAKAIVESAELIVGEQEAVKTFGLQLGDSVELFREQVEGEIGRRLEHDEVLVLTDMQAGSPFNVTVAAMDSHRFRHITGMNLPMLLEVFSSRPHASLDEVCDRLVERARETVLDVNELIAAMDAEEGR